MKQYDTLILNKLYIPIYIVNWKRAVSVLYQDSASSLDKDLTPYNYEDWITYTESSSNEDYYKLVHSSKVTLAVPDILVLKNYKCIPKRDTKYTRDNLFSRDGYKCAYCGKRFNRSDLTVDHIIPKSVGGENSWVNTVSACRICNNIKADRTPKQAGMPLLYQPTEPRWCDSLSKISANPNIRPNWLTFLNAIGI